MEDILNLVSNPFENDNFNRIIGVFLGSKDRYDFYEKLVTYQKDKIYDNNEGEKKDCINYIKDYPYLQLEELIGWGGVLRHFSQIFPTQHRIYINAPQSGISNILDYFIAECEAQDLPFELKFANSEDYQRNDSIVIGSHTSVYEKHIEILKEFAKLNPDIIKKCGTPPLMTGKLDGWLGIADEYTRNRQRSYSEQRIDIIQESVMKYVIQNEERLELKGNEDVEAFKRALEDYEERKANYGLNGENEVGRHCKISKEIKEKLELAISNQPDLIDEIHEIFIKICVEHGLDENNPIFNANSQTELKDFNGTKKKVIDNDVLELLQQADATHIFNFLLDENIEQLDTQSRIKMIKLFVEKDMSEKFLERRMICDVNALHESGIIGDDTFRMFRRIYNGDYSLALDDSKDKYSSACCFYNYYVENPIDDITLGNDLFFKKRNEEYFKRRLGEPYLAISKEEQEQKLNARINEIIKFFETKTIDEATQQKRIENANKAMNMLSENRYFPLNQRLILSNDIFMLESNIEKQSDIEEVSKMISEELGNSLANGKGIRKITRAIMKYNNMEMDDTDNR